MSEPQPVTSDQQPDQQAAPPSGDAPPSPAADTAPAPGGPTQTPSQPPAAPGSKWGNVVKGALAGLLQAGPGGALLGAIAPKTAQAGLANRQAAVQAKTQQAQANVRFTDAQSANQAVLTNISAMKAEHLPAEQKEMDEDNARKRVQFNQEHLGVTYQEIPNNPDSFRQYLATQTASQGGATLGSVVVSPTTLYIPQTGGDDSTDPVKKFQTVQSMATAIGVAAPDRATYFGLKPQAKAAALKPIENVFHGKNPDGSDIPYEKLPGVISRMQQAAKQYAAQPGADKAVADQLNGTVADLQNQKAAGDAHENEKNAAKTKVGQDIATTRNMSRGVVVAGPNGSTQYSTIGAAIKSGAVTDKTAKSLEPLEKTAEDAEKSYQMFQSAYSDFKQGTTTGAQSMLALSQHLATTFGGVKGARITRDMIQEHLGARGISDSALVAVQKLSNGDVLSPDQWGAFNGLISQSRKFSWGTYATSAAAKGVNVRGLIPKDLGGQRDISTVPISPADSKGAAQSDGGTITHVSSDGKWAWNGKSWIANPKGK